MCVYVQFTHTHIHRHTGKLTRELNIVRIWEDTKPCGSEPVKQTNALCRKCISNNNVFIYVAGVALAAYAPR